jgi:GNAT superfamily N-acetyltransferase
VDRLLIRPIEKSDSLERLTALLHRAYAPLGARSLNFTAVDQTVEDTRYRISRGVCALALVDDAVVGTVTVCGGPFPQSQCAWYREPRVAFAGQFAVEPSFQRRGIGAELMCWAEAWARDRGYSELAVDTAEPAAHLIAYYERRGHRRVDEVQWPGKRYRSVILSKSLAAS